MLTSEPPVIPANRKADAPARQNNASGLKFFFIIIRGKRVKLNYKMLNRFIITRLVITLCLFDTIKSKYKNNTPLL